MPKVEMDTLRFAHPTWQIIKVSFLRAFERTGSTLALKKSTL